MHAVEQFCKARTTACTGAHKLLLCVCSKYCEITSIKKIPFKDGIEFYYNGWKKDGLGYIKKENIQKNIKWIEEYKILIPKAWGIGSMDKDWLNPFIIAPNSCCTETYLVIGPFSNKKTADVIISYTQTKFFHFLVLLIKNTQNAMKKVYQFVPIQNFTEPWTDEKLYAKYGLTEEEIAFIDSMIRPMDMSKNENDDQNGFDDE